MTLLILSFIAGLLTVAAPCILPLLPVIVGGSLARGGKKPTANRGRPLRVTASLAVSVILFTLLLKATTSLLGIPELVWRLFSASIIVLLGVNFLWPRLWERLPIASKMNIASNKFLGRSYGRQGAYGDLLTGFALGPVFNSCSPTYALIVATVLPASFALGFIYLAGYAVGLASALLIVTYAGQAVVGKLGWLSDPSAWFRKAVGAVFILVGISVGFGWDRSAQAWVLERGWYDPVSGLEERLK